MTNVEIESMFKGTFETALGQKCLAHLGKVFVDRPMYMKGSTLEDAAYRQGQADLVNQIIREVTKDGR